MAVAATLPSPVLDGDKIVSLVKDRLKTFQGRNDWYQVLQSYYDGPYFTPPGSPALKAMNSQGRPQLRDSDGGLGGSIDKARRYSSQRLAAAVDDKASLKGRMPISRVEPPSPDDEGQQKSEKLTKYLYSTYELSHLESQQPEAGKLLSLLGDVVYLLEPGTEDEAQDRVVWTVVHPASCYPEFRHGHRRFELFNLAVVETWSAADIRQNFEVSIRDDASPAERTVVTFLSPHQRTVLVGLERWRRVRHAEWDLGFCPAQWVFNKPGMQMGQSDIGQALDQQDLLDFAMSVWADGIVHMTYSVPVVKDPLSTGQDPPTIGPNAVPFLVSRDGDLQFRNAGGDPTSIMHMVQQNLADINAAIGSSQVRQEGQMHGSIQTGRAIQAAQGPESTRIEAFHESFGAAWRELNAKTLKMQEKAPALNQWKGDIFGRYKGQSFKEEMAASEIEGWYRTTVTWETLVGMNPMQKLEVAMQGNVAKFWDKPYGMEMVGIEDPHQMLQRVETEIQREAHWAQLQQAGMQGGQPGSPGGGGAAAPQGPSPSGSPTAPQLLRRPPGLDQVGQAPAGGVPVGASIPGLRKVLAAIPNLKGEVYAVGELAKSGQSPQVSLAITEAQDHRKVMEAVKEFGSPRVRHVAKDKLPPEAVKLA